MSTSTIAELSGKRNVKVTEAAQVLGVSRGKVYQLMDSGALKSVHIDTARRIPLDALENYLAQIRGETN